MTERLKWVWELVVVLEAMKGDLLSILILS
jgi:hypothetical protein